MSDLSFRQKVFQSPKTGSARFIYQLAKLGLSVSICIVCLGSAIISGFTSAVESKLTQFLGNARLTEYGYTIGDNSKTLAIDSITRGLDKSISTLAYTEQAAIAFTQEALFQAVTILGVEERAVQDKWQKQLSSGRFPQFDSSSRIEIALSSSTVQHLGLALGDTVRLQFADAFKNRVRNRNAILVGIISTGVSEFNSIAIWNIEHAHTMLNLKGRAHHIALFQEDIEVDAVQTQVPYSIECVPIQNAYPNVFQWLDLQASNELVIGSIIAIVAFFNCMSIVYVLVVEKRATIAIFRVQGASAAFIAQSMYWFLGKLLWHSILIGGSLACLIAMSLEYGQWIPLDETTYYITYVPAKIVPLKWVLYAVLSFVVAIPAAVLPFSRFLKIELDILASQHSTQLP